MEPTRPEKILIAMHALAKGTTQPCRYEDIVVKAFEMFPEEFQLRGYPKYPDSSDIHKPLYGPLKRQGLVRAAHKNFALTEKGLTRSIDLAAGSSPGNQPREKAARLTRDMESEISRIQRSEAAKLFADGQGDKMLDTDFFSYLGVSVRTSRNDFIGRLKAVEDAVKTAAEVSPSPVHDGMLRLHGLLKTKFFNIIQKLSGAIS